MNLPDNIGGRYRIEELIGSGAMGDVYRGVDTREGISVAIKHLKPEVVSRLPDVVTRFEREGAALRDLNHPNIVRVLATVSEDEGHYIVMEYVPGGSLQGLIAGGDPLPVKRAAQIALDLADALTRAHRLGIIHRDIKPENILIAGDGTPRLTDFGVAHHGGMTTLTEAGQLIGTYAYLSPEACMGLPIDARADIWAFGIVLYEMLIGERPFKGTNPGAIVNSIISLPLPDPKEIRSEIPDDLNDLLYRMLDKTVEARIPSVRLVGAALEALLNGTSLPGISTQGDTPARTELVFTTSASTPADHKHNLPAQVIPFVGREAELAELGRLVTNPANRLITILASGGMGKTRLSLEVGRNALSEFVNGVVFVELAPLSMAEDIPMAIAEAADFPPKAGELIDQLTSFFAEKRALLILDNFEHVIKGAAFVDTLIRGAPGLTVLATSRQRLNLSAEAIFTIDGMDFPEWETPQDALRYSAVQLFMQSARRARVDFEIRESDLDYVARICRFTGGMPLGILLAAAWVDTLTLEEIAGELAQGVDLLETDMADIPERQRSIRAVFEYSWNLLGDDERAAFARMSVFRGGFTRAAAGAVGGASLRMLTSLVNKSLLGRDAASGRFSVHELLRQIAAEHLDRSDDVATLREAHARYYLKGLIDRLPDLKGRDQKKALDDIQSDFENVKSAWYWAVEHGGEALINAAIDPLYNFLRFRSRTVDGEMLFEAARARWPAPDENASALVGRLHIRFVPEPDLTPRLDIFEHGLAIARKHDDPLELAFALNQVGRRLTHAIYDFPRGMPLMEESLTLYKTHGDQFAIAEALDDMAFSKGMKGDGKGRIALAQESLAIRRQIGDRVGEAGALRNIGVALTDGSDFVMAAQSFQQALEVSRSIGDRLNEAWALSQLVFASFFSGDFEGSQPLLDRAYSIAREINDRDILAICMLTESYLAALLEEDYDRALDLIEKAHPVDATPNMLTGSALMGHLIAHAGRGDHREVVKVLRYAMDLLELFAAYNAESLMIPFPFLSMALANAGRFEEAAECIGIYDQGHHGYLQGIDVSSLYQRHIQKLEKALGKASFEAAKTLGASKPPEDFRHLIDELESA